jgi:S1-C subfamily serine protease
MNNDSINRLYESVVRIEVNSILFDWDVPFAKSKAPTGSGTGFLIDNKGHILTCFHVVNQSVHLFVTLPYSGKKKFPAKIISIFPEMDLAIIKIEAKINRFLELGDSDSIKIGKEVLAIGYPLGQGKLKITKGIVSGLESGFIQTDAPINPGNSGGPLIYEGKVIGINTAKIVEIGAEGVGYANPINYFNKIKKRMLPPFEIETNVTIANGPTIDKTKDKTKNKIIRIEEATLGILPESCSKQIMDFYECECPSGIQMIRVLEKSPLKLGEYPAKDGDILCAIEDYIIDNNGDCKVPWNREKVSYREVFDRLSFEKDKIKVSYYTILKNENIKHNGGFFNLNKYNLDYLLKSVGIRTEPKQIYKTHGKIVTKTINIIPTREVFKIWNRYPPYDEIKYICFGGIVFMNLTMNHLMMKQYQHLFYNYLNKLDEEAVIITKILPSGVKIDSLLSEGDIIKEINNIPIFKLEDVDNALKNPVYKLNKDNQLQCYITFKTALGKFYTVKLSKVVREDLQLFQVFNYELSEATKFFLKNIKDEPCLININKVKDSENDSILQLSNSNNSNF